MAVMKKNWTRENGLPEWCGDPHIFYFFFVITKMTKNHKQRVQFEPIHKNMCPMTVVIAMIFFSYKKLPYLCDSLSLTSWLWWNRTGQLSEGVIRFASLVTTLPTSWWASPLWWWETTKENSGRSTTSAGTTQHNSSPVVAQVRRNCCY